MSKDSKNSLQEDIVKNSKKGSFTTKLVSNQKLVKPLSQANLSNNTSFSEISKKRISRYDLAKNIPSRDLAESKNRFTSPTDKFLDQVNSEYLWSKNIFVVLKGQGIPKDVQVIEEKSQFTVVRSDKPLPSKLYAVKNKDTGVLGYYTGKVILTGDDNVIEIFLTTHSLNAEKIINTYVVNVQDIQEGINIKSSAQQDYKNLQVDLDFNFSRESAK